MAEQPKEIQADVLVLGGGLAGCWAALRAKDFVDNVVLVDKSKVSKSGMSTFASGVLVYWTPEDELKPWMREACEGGAFLNDQEFLEASLVENYDRIAEMDAWGAGFEKDANGKIERIVGRGHQTSRLMMFHGQQLMHIMRRQVLQRKIRLVERIMITDLLTSDGRHPTQGRVIGALGINTRTGESVVFKAKATVLAVGSIESKVGGHYTDNITGDGYGMAFRAGAELTGMEFYPVGNLSVWNREFHTVGINMIQGLGAKLVNARGEQFMEKYAPGIKDRAHLYTLAQAMAKESLESRGPIYADMRNFTPEAIEKCKRVIPRFMRMFGESGIDIRGQIVELTPGVRFRAPTMPGGVRINIRCESTVLGLFAAGASTKGASHGADEGLGGLNLTYCNVSGHRAGENAVKQARGTDEPEVDQDQVESLLDNLRAPSRVKDGIFADEVFERVKATTIPARYSIFKNEKRMREVLKEVERVEQEDLPRVMAPDAHELVKANELKNYVLAVKLSYLAGLERKESRCYLYREEFPFQDNDNWLVWQIQRNEGGKVATRIERIPFERYPIEPPSGKIPAPVQYTFSD